MEAISLGIFFQLASLGFFFFSLGLFIIQEYHCPCHENVYESISEVHASRVCVQNGQF